ncbi:MAG: hypothetical protein WCP29_01345 [Acidobacteriota bacterium]
MKTMARAALVLTLTVGVAASGCAAASNSLTPTSPTGTNVGAQTIGSLSAGTWASFDPLSGTGSVVLNPGSCGNFKWAVTSLTLVNATGTFSADCGGGLALAGNATASLAGTVATWGAAGDVTGPGAACKFVVTGTAALEAGGVRVTYNATVCNALITGSELLKKH